MKTGMESARINEFNTRRLILRLMSEEEWDELLFRVVYANECYFQFGEEKSEELLTRFKKPFYHRTIYFSIHLPETDELIGYIGYATDIQYIEYYIFDDHRRYGYAYEAVRGLMRNLFNGTLLGKRLDELHAWVVWDNKASANLLEKLGFEPLEGYRIFDNGTAGKFYDFHRHKEDAA